MSRAVLLDASFLVALERETALGQEGPARRFLPALRGRPLVISVVTVEEILEGAADELKVVAVVHSGDDVRRAKELVAEEIANAVLH